MLIFSIITGVVFFGGCGLALAGFLRYQRGKENEDEEDVVRGQQWLFIAAGIVAISLIAGSVGMVIWLREAGSVLPQGNGGGMTGHSPVGSGGINSLSNLGGNSVVVKGGDGAGSTQGASILGYSWSFTTGDGGRNSENVLLLSSNPRPGEKDVCRNVLGVLRFNKQIDIVSENNFVRVEKKQQGEWQSLENVPVMHRVQGKDAQMGTEVLIGSLNSVLDPLQEYRIVVPSLQIVLPFSTGSSLCKIHDVIISVSPPTGGGADLFTCAQDAGCEDDQNAGRLGNQHVYSAQARDVKGTPLTAEYNWSTPSLLEPIITLDASTTFTSTGTALPRNGTSLVEVKAFGPLKNNVPDSAWGKASGSKEVEVFLCDNPWPRRGAFPFIDQSTHFSFFFCRDSGQPGVQDDLPGLRVVPAVSPSDPRGIKEYIFPLDIPDAKEALGVKVMRNPLDYGPKIWYEENITPSRYGAPTPMLVDGFQAVRDGTTIYVHAPNVGASRFFTNMYLLSYTTNSSSPELLQIWQQVVNHWRFAINVNAQEKILLTRDTKRLGDVSDTTKILNSFYALQGHYPSLVAGSFISGSTTSAWPSWQQTLGKELGVTLPIDPVNSFGECPGHDAATCWNEVTRKFAGSIPDRLPLNSYVYMYRSLNKTASRYSLCAIMESNRTKAHNSQLICSLKK